MTQHVLRTFVEVLITFSREAIDCRMVLQAVP